MSTMSRIYASALRSFARAERFGATSPSIELIVHPEAEPWRPSNRCLAKLETELSGRAHLWPRHLASRVLGRSAAPYAFRAFTRDGVSHLFVDPTETPTSICWLLAHELSHQQLAHRPGVQTALRAARPQDLDPSGDAFHQVDPEERYCDGIATRLVGQRLDRDWWRARTQRR